MIQGMNANSGYVWFLPAWFTNQWYLSDRFNKLTSDYIPCSSAHMSEAVQGHFLLNTAFLGPDISQIVGNVTVHQWYDIYKTRIAALVSI